MQIILSDKELEKLRDNVDTTKFGWINDAYLQNNPKYKAVREYNSNIAVFGQKVGD
jgi:hypothetical protein